MRVVDSRGEGFIVPESLFPQLGGLPSLHLSRGRQHSIQHADV